MDEPLIAAVIGAIFGLIIGSFLNVCIYRLPRGLSIVTPRSFCTACKAPVAWYDNIPIISYLWLRARCRNCAARIHWRYPATEAATSMLFFAVGYRWGLTPEGLKWASFGALLIVLFWTDLETRLLPDVLTLGGTAVGLVFAAFVPLHSFWLSPFLLSAARTQSVVVAAASAFLLAAPFLLFAEVYARLRRVVPLGLGDVKLVAMLGMFLGLERALIALMIGSTAGAVIGLGYIWGTGRNPKTEPVPYGSFLCAAGLLAVFWGSDLFIRWWRAGM